jgi:hypothetical protein
MPDPLDAFRTHIHAALDGAVQLHLTTAEDHLQKPAKPDHTPGLLHEKE